MTFPFGFSISNIPLNIAFPSIPVNVEPSDSLVICANDIGIGNVSLGLVIVPISLENDCSSSHSSTFISSKPGSIVLLLLSMLCAPMNSFCPVEKCPSKRPSFFFAFSVL